ncbi:ubiquinol-cytochrome-c reductase complex assembly factor 1 [Sergentomyia squamirostris]
MLRIALNSLPQSQLFRNAAVLGTIPRRWVANTPQRSQESEAHVIAAQHPDKKSGILSKLQKKFGWSGDSQSKLKLSSYLIYESIVDRLNYVEFFRRFNLPNTFNSWFLVTELHVWMVLTRAMAEGPERGENGRFMRNCIVEAMWSDVNARAKKLDPQNPSAAKKHIEILSHQFQAALINYDEGLMSDDKVLAGALWRRFFEKECNNYEMLEDLVKYVREHVKMLEMLSNDNFVQKPQVQWKDITSH